jgi:peptide-methionine (S)-S-oxide reductase
MFCLDIFRAGFRCFIQPGERRNIRLFRRLFLVHRGGCRKANGCVRGHHREAAQVIYDPALISFADLVRHVYATIDYEDNDGQFCDRGRPYTPAIYYKTQEQAEIAASLAPASSIVPIEPETEFFPVRTEHQDYYKKNPLRYKFYRSRCGRDRRIEELAR